MSSQTKPSAFTQEEIELAQCALRIRTAIEHRPANNAAAFQAWNTGMRQELKKIQALQSDNIARVPVICAALAHTYVNSSVFHHDTYQEQLENFTRDAAEGDGRLYITPPSDVHVELGPNRWWLTASAPATSAAHPSAHPVPPAVTAALYARKLLSHYAQNPRTSFTTEELERISLDLSAEGPLTSDEKGVFGDGPFKSPASCEACANARKPCIWAIGCPSGCLQCKSFGLSCSFCPSQEAGANRVLSYPQAQRYLIQWHKDNFTAASSGAPHSNTPLRLPGQVQARNSTPQLLVPETRVVSGVKRRADNEADEASGSGAGKEMREGHIGKKARLDRSGTEPGASGAVPASSQDRTLVQLPATAYVGAATPARHVRLATAVLARMACDTARKSLLDRLVRGEDIQLPPKDSRWAVRRTQQYPCGVTFEQGPHESDRTFRFRRLKYIFNNAIENCLADFYGDWMARASAAMRVELSQSQMALWALTRGRTDVEIQTEPDAPADQTPDPSSLSPHTTPKSASGTSSTANASLFSLVLPVICPSPSSSSLPSAGGSSGGERDEGNGEQIEPTPTV
ncbi:hypothetical protein BXZ70DRAFT_1011799 [Cristinia sonorae]|uniref:Uncharacterized protein n=1 Tax=Cristinia sonorae TaxID=1940300 RepID=A0A8K0UFN4_9AGAR|nr:hypothetical protein BXZ70DRAFT_1011799 [Cristinia sonorae]